jgi:hypothetical protein
LAGSVPPASARFRFRFVARGELTNTIVAFAIQSLKRCHPNVNIVLIDANDVPTLDPSRFPISDDFVIVHAVPEDDAVAQAVGRGSRRHLFYWRHSPQLLRALPPSNLFDVHSDADIIFVRPLNFASLLAPLEKGRIAAALDESTLDYYASFQSLAATIPATLFPVGVSGGPLLQAGLLFTNPADDGDFYDLFWSVAAEAARAGHLPSLPWDDMGIATSLLTQGGSLWERLLILGHDWNYITDATKDAGVFGRAAHYGGRRAQALLLEHYDPVIRPEQAANDWWGRVGLRGISKLPFIAGSSKQLLAALDHSPDCGSSDGIIPLTLPCVLSWNVPINADGLDLYVDPLISDVRGSPKSSAATVFVYLDGDLTSHCVVYDRRSLPSIPLGSAETVTIIAVSESADGQMCLTHAFTRKDEGLAG